MTAEVGAPDITEAPSERSELWRYIGKRLFLGLIAIIGVSIITFVALRLSGDPAVLLLPADARPEDLAAIRERLGLDEPIWRQYLVYVGGLLSGDFGQSIKYQIPAMDLIGSRVVATLQLAIPAFIVSLLGGVGLGVIAAVRRGKVTDKAASVFGLAGQALPGFWVGTMLILVFSVQLGWLPTSGRGSWQHMVLPVITASWFSVAAMLRLTRSSMIEALDSDYVTMARLKGQSEFWVTLSHALRNSLIPVITFAGLNLAVFLGGTVIVETVFAWPGLGKLMVDSIAARDYPVVQAGVVIAATVFILMNLAVDISYGFIDPRVRRRGG